MGGASEIARDPSTDSLLEAMSDTKFFVGKPPPFGWVRDLLGRSATEVVR